MNRPRALVDRAINDFPDQAIRETITRLSTFLPPLRVADIDPILRETAVV